MTAGAALGLNVVRPTVETEKEAAGATKRNWRTLIRPVAGALITAVGIALVLLIVFLYAFTPLTNSRDQHRLLAELTSDSASNSKATFALTRGIIPPEGRPVALLRIPALHLRQAVVAGTSASDLEGGPGLMPGTVLPGEAGNAVIAGRRLTFGAPFAALGTLRSGDMVSVTDGLGTFRYRIHSVRTVLAGRSDVVGPSPDNRLTLVTSNSSTAPGGRLVAVGSLVHQPVRAPTPPPTVTPATELGLSGDPGAGGSIALWLDLLIVVGAATGFAVWRWRRPLPTYLLAMPVILACGLFAAEAVARALPATL